MAKQWKPDNTTTYTYESVDGTRYTINAGEEGVSEELILLLKAYDNQSSLQERYEEENTDYSFRHRMRDYHRDPDNERGNPMEGFADPAADLMGLLFPEEKKDSPQMEKLHQAFEQLTEGQKDLVYELYGLCKSMSDIAREQDVSLTAIQNRRSKLLKRLQKMLEEQKP